eukprot:1412088-Prymnesium_polylepis.1
MKWEALTGKSLVQLRQTASTLMEERPARKRYFRCEKVEEMGTESLAKGIWRSTHDRKHPNAREDSGDEASAIGQCEEEAAHEATARKKAAREQVARQKALRKKDAREQA